MARKSEKPASTDVGGHSGGLRARLGNLWRSAPPSSEPAANATRGRVMRRWVVSFKSSVTDPTSEIAPIASPPATIQVRVVTLGSSVLTAPLDKRAVSSYNEHMFKIVKPPGARRSPVRQPDRRTSR